MIDSEVSHVPYILWQESLRRYLSEQQAEDDHKRLNRLDELLPRLDEMDV
jgi:hypothetical protein